MNDHEVVRRLIEAMDSYDREYPYYDEVFSQVSGQIRERGEAGKADLAVLICWKRPRLAKWMARLMNEEDAIVRAHTRAAFASGLNDQERLDKLSGLPGFRSKDAMATVVLTSYNPDEYGVKDSRAITALDPQHLDRRIELGRGETLRYLDRVRELRDLTRHVRPAVTARDIDKGLYVIGGR